MLDEACKEQNLMFFLFEKLDADFFLTTILPMNDPFFPFSY